MVPYANAFAYCVIRTWRISQAELVEQSSLFLESKAEETESWRTWKVDMEGGCIGLGKKMTTFKDIQDRFRDELVAENKGQSRLMTLVKGDFKIKRLNDTGNAGVLGGEMARSAGKVFQVSWYCNIEKKEMTETFEKTKKKLLPASFKIAAYYLRSINEQPRMDTLIRFFPEPASSKDFTVAGRRTSQPSLSAISRRCWSSFDRSSW